MSNTSEEESQHMVDRMALLSKSDGGVVNTAKKRRNPPGNPDPDADVVALSPRTLLTTNRYICEVCHKGFQRDQNLQLHRRGHNLPWKLKQRSSTEVKKRVYVCPEVTCAHHDPCRALGDLTGIKKHYSRKHGEKKWKCDKCSKRYAVQSDWKAHSKICGTKEYRCDCGTIFSRKDSFVTHRAFCDALTEENYRANHGLATMVGNYPSQSLDMLSHSMPSATSSIMDNSMHISSSDPNQSNPFKPLVLNPLLHSNSDMLFNNGNLRTSVMQLSGGSSSLSMSMGPSFMSATALLQKAAEMGAKVSDEPISPILLSDFSSFSNNMRSSGSVPDTINSYRLENAEAISEAGRARFMPPSTGGSYVGIQNTTSKRAGDTSRFRTTFAPFPLGGDSKVDSICRQDAGEEVAEGRSGRMTQDFLGLGASGTVGSAGNPNYHEEMYSYHQMSHGPTTLEKHMWE